MVIVFSLVIFIAPCSLHAQVADNIQSYDSGVNEGDFEFEVSPENPGPHQSVTVHVTSNLVDTNRYPITWTVNGKTVTSGIGSRTITVTTGDYGQTIDVAMAIKLAESVVTKQITLTPQDTTLLWEAADSYVPPFYPGKKLPSYESLVRIVSIPNFLTTTSGGSKSAVYNWSRNNSVVPDAGGYGKDSMLIQHNRVRPSEIIEATVSSTDGSASAASQITVPFFDPKILFYEKNPVTGLKSLFAKSNIYFGSDAATIIAEPYFFSTPNGNPNTLSFDWTMNKKSISINNTKNPETLQLQNPGTAGVAQIGLTVTVPTKLFQTAANSLSAAFNGTKK